MKQQVVVIHGGDAFGTYKEYLESLRAIQLDFTKLSRVGWKDGLGKALGKKYQVIAPKMPNAWNARYKEWKIWFDKFIPFLDDGVIFVGHSLGGIFLTKYLSENIFPKKIKAVLLVAAPYNTTDSHPLVDFNIKKSLGRLGEQVGEIIIYHSKDDKVVPFSNAKRYARELPMATFRSFTDRGHFNQERLPELVKDIKNIK